MDGIAVDGHLRVVVVGVAVSSQHQRPGMNIGFTRLVEGSYLLLL